MLITFKEINKNQKDDILFCMVDETDLNTPNYIKNISDWTIQNITIQGYTVLQSSNEKDLVLKAIRSESDYAVIIKSGIEPINRYYFFDEIKKYAYENDFIVAGEKECYIINLNAVRKEINDGNLYNYPFSELPKTVYDNLKNYNDVDYYFPFKRDNFCSSLAVYPTDNVEINRSLEIEKLDQLVTPASGLNWANYLSHYGYDNTTVVKFYDYSISALEYTKELVKFNGEDYSKFFKEFFNQKFNFLGNKNDLEFCGPDALQHHWDEINKVCDWNDIIKNVSFEFYWVDLLDDSEEYEWITPNKSTIVNASNVFNYIGNNTQHGLYARARLENSFLRKLNNIDDSIIVNFDRRSCDAFYDYKRYYGTVGSIDRLNYKKILLPTWHSQ